MFSEEATYLCSILQYDVPLVYKFNYYVVPSEYCCFVEKFTSKVIEQ
jgi:hypothetical protein